MNASALSPSEARVYGELEAAANAGLPCPSNAELGQRIASVSSGASYLVRGLEAKGFIKVARFNRARRVTIVATGTATAMPEGGQLAEPVVSGADLAQRLKAHAESSGTTLTALLAPLSTDPSKWLNQLRAASRPKRSTIERVEALLEGLAVPPSPANNFQKSGPSSGKWAAEPRLDSVASMPRVDRDPCPRCGARRDIGCSHTARAVSSRISL